MKRVLILGGAGFIGSHTADILYDNGYDITILDNLHHKNHYNKWPEYLRKEYKLVEGDVTDRKILTNLISETDYIYHFAAEMDLSPEFHKFIDINVSSTALIYEIILKNNFKIKKIIIASSQFVYGEGKWRSKDNMEFYPPNRTKFQMLQNKWEILDSSGNNAYYIHSVEDQLVNPPNHYAISKYFQEQLALKLGKLYNIKTVCMRYSIVHGPRQSLKNTYSGALRTFAFSCIANIPFATFEDNNSLRDFVSVFDVANANKLVLEKDEADFEIFNVGGNELYSVYELASMVSEYFGKTLEFNSSVEFRLGDIRHAISNCDKLKKLGWNPIHNERDTIYKYLQWFKTQNLDVENFLKIQELIRVQGVVLKA